MIEKKWVGGNFGFWILDELVWGVSSGIGKIFLKRDLFRDSGSFLVHFSVIGDIGVCI